MLQDNRSSRSQGAEFNPASPIGSYVAVVRWLVSNSRDFYASMPVSGGFNPPALFAAISFVVPILATSVFTHQAGLPLRLGLLNVVNWLVFVFIMHLAVTKLSAGQADFQATFRVTAYASFVILVGVIPMPQPDPSSQGQGLSGAVAVYFLVLAAAQIYGYYLIVRGLSVVHRISVGQGVKAVFVAIIVQTLASLFLGREILERLTEL